MLEELDLGAIGRDLQAKDARGERPYSPRMMTALLLLYGYAVGIFSSRRMARTTFEDGAFPSAGRRRALAGPAGRDLRRLHGVDGAARLQRAAIADPSDADGTPMATRPSGFQYHLACPPCSVLSVVAQWT